MGKAAEARNDVAVAQRVIGITREEVPLVFRRLDHQCRKQLDAAILQFDRFGMLQRQITEHALDAPQFALGTAVDQFQCQLQRQRITGKGPGRVAMDVARELVKQQDQRQTAARRFSPVFMQAGGRGIDQRAKTRAHFRINCCILAPPQLAPGLRGHGVVTVGAEPEVEHVFCGGWQMGHDRQVNRKRRFLP